LIVTSSEEDPEFEEREIDHLLARRLDALVIASVRSNAKAYQRIAAQGTPYILIDRKFPGDRGFFVGCDDTQIGLMATEHLIEMGCKKIAHIRGPRTSTGNGRYNGYKKALSRHGLPMNEAYIVDGKAADVNGQHTGAVATAALLKLRHKPDGIFCFNDPLALGALKMLLERNIRIPEDVALIGCGNIHYDDSFRVPLSSIDQQSHQIGKQAALLALELIKSRNRGLTRQVLLDPAIVIRASSRRT